MLECFMGMGSYFIFQLLNPSSTLGMGWPSTGVAVGDY